MRIIDKVEVSYFRSIYTVSLKDCNHLNVITGSNDAGKSNMLRALNLFFNNETDPHQDFDFLRDLCRYRETEARSTKGRMTIWIRVTFNNFLGWKSLPDKFAVKKTWNRYNDNPVDSVESSIPATTLGRFLAKLNLHYIPAVRSREIFSDLLADLHDTLLQDESIGLRESSDALVRDLHAITRDLSEDILERVKISSTIDLPESLEDLFRALNFVTKFGNHDIPLTFRGDGLQSRHLPFILAYIAEKSKGHHIWAYEEPENSLELSKAFEMAKDFSEKFARDNQIFMTTHSPAFYDLDGPSVTKWYAESVEADEIRSTRFVPITNTSTIDKTMGLLHVITPRMKEVYEESERLRSSLTEMEERFNAAAMPVAYVEGPTDVEILMLAKKALGRSGMGVTFLPAHGASEITQYLKVSSRFKSDDRPLLGIYDSDARGRKEFETFKSSHILPNTSMRMIDQPKKIFAGTLLVPDHLKDVEKTLQHLKIEIPLPIEFMFEWEILARAIDEGALALEPRKTRLADAELPLEVKIEDALRGQIPDDKLYIANKVSKSCKTAFAEWLAGEGKKSFDPFAQLFDEIAEAIAA